MLGGSLAGNRIYDQRIMDKRKNYNKVLLYNKNNYKIWNINDSTS